MLQRFLRMSFSLSHNQRYLCHTFTVGAFSAPHMGPPPRGTPARHRRCLAQAAALMAALVARPAGPGTGSAAADLRERNHRLVSQFLFVLLFHSAEQHAPAESVHAGGIRQLTWRMC